MTNEEMRALLKDKKRIVIKVGSASITHAKTGGLYLSKIEKLVRVISGEVFDAVVDLRKDSPTYGKSFGVILSAENRKQLFIPKGFAHGFVVLSDYAEFFYKVSDFYHPNDEGGLLWNDPEVGIDWPIKDESELNIIERDQNWPKLSELK